MSDLSGFSMFELFKEEAASNATALSNGLLAIEAAPQDLAEVEKLMRAAHSLKGAARIVGLDEVVELAHVMEDCFVAVQKSEERLTSARVDQLLRGVDVFQELSELAEDNLDDWLATQKQSIQQLTRTLSQPPDDSETAPPSGAVDQESKDAETAPGRPSETSPQDAALEPPQPSLIEEATQPQPTEPAKAESEPAAEDRTVPVNATNLNRIMRLASESMVEARQLQSMQQSIASLRDVQRKFSNLLQQSDKKQANGNATVDYDELRALSAKSAELLQDHAERLERTLWRSERTSTALYHQVIGSRMRPFSEGTVAFPRMIRDLSRSLNKQVGFELRGGSVSVDRDILRKLEAPLNHILRNCVDHGIESPQQRQAAGKPAQGNVVLEARHHAGMLTILVRDDGGGINTEALRNKIVERQLVEASMVAELTDAEIMEFLFLPGFSTAGQVTEVSGRGVGLDVVRTMVQEVSGTVRVESELGQGTTFTLHLPVTLSMIRAALAEIAGEAYAFPLAKLVRIVRVGVDEIRPIQGKQQFMMDDESVGLVRAADILDLPGSSDAGEMLSVIVIGQDEQPCGLAVDRFIGEQDLVVRPLDRRLGKVPHISAAAVTEEGAPLLIVDIEDLLLSMRQLLGEGRLRGMTSVSAEQVRIKPKVLVVDDSITVREVERQLLVAHGYDVDVAVDGQDGWHALRGSSYDLLVTDVDMPRMNGIELIRTVRGDSRFEHLPIIIVSYKDREEDRMGGFEAGANAYLTKGSFHDDSFVKTVTDLIGEVD